MADRQEKIKKIKQLLIERELRKRGSAKKERTSKTEAFARGAAQGGTLGFADEIQAFFRSVSDPKGPLAESLQELKAIGKGEELPERKASFGKILEEEQAKVKRARIEQPGAFLAGDIAGGLATAAIPGAGLAKFGTSAKGLVGTGAVVGGISGAGRAEEDRIASALIGATVGAGTGVLGSALGATIKKGGQLVERAAAGKLGRKAKEKTIDSSIDTLRQNLKIAGESDKGFARNLDVQLKALSKKKEIFEEIPQEKQTMEALEFLKDRLKASGENEKAFAKNLEAQLNAFSNKRELNKNILTEAAKAKPITERLKEPFKLPSTPTEVLKDVGSIATGGVVGPLFRRAAGAVAPELLRKQEQLRAGGRAAFPALVGQEPNLFELGR